MPQTLPTSLVCLDFETTGLAPEAGDRITEVGLVRVAGGRIVERFASLVNSGKRIPRSITAYTGITQKMVDDAPASLEVMPQVLAFIEGSSVVSHNAQFDQLFLQAECRRLGLPVPRQPFLCSMRIARHLYPLVRPPSLAELARVLALPVTGVPHRAAADAEMTAQLALRLLRDLDARPAATPEPMSRLARMQQWSGGQAAPAI